jgi:hypothetical protein
MFDSKERLSVCDQDKPTVKMKRRGDALRIVRYCPSVERSSDLP